jgi:hypothetical protein
MEEDYAPSLFYSLPSDKTAMLNGFGCLNFGKLVQPFVLKPM